VQDSTRTNDYISIRDFTEAVGSKDWPVLADGATAFFPTGSFAASARLVHAIARLGGIEAHPAKVDIRAGGVTLRLVTASNEWFGMSRRDADFARRISAAAADLGLKADSSAVQSVEPIVIGAVDIKKVMPFWQALMGYVQRPDSPDEDIIDPRGRGPGVWFEQLQQPQAARNRMHLAVWVPHDQAEARVAAAVAAGGTVIYDKLAPAWWTLAGPEGNEADIATSTGRDEWVTLPDGD
jgi:4a-hydroxytetrahydrobiopterin dehydratase